MTKNKELITKQKNELAFELSEDDLALMMEDSEEYGHTADADDLTTPRLKLVQMLSSVLDKNDKSYIEGVEAGDIVEPLSRKVFKDKVSIVPIKTFIQYLEWQGTGKQAKIINNYGNDATLFKKHQTEGKVDKKGKVQGTCEDSRIIKTYNVYALIIDGKEASLTVIPMAGSKAKVAKELNTHMISQVHPQTGKRLPAFAYIYELESVPESYEGNNYFNYKVNFVKNNFTISHPEIGKTIYQMAKGAFDMIQEEDLSKKTYSDIEDDLV